MNSNLENNKFELCLDNLTASYINNIYKVQFNMDYMVNFGQGKYSLELINYIRSCEADNDMRLPEEVRGLPRAVREMYDGSPVEIPIKTPEGVSLDTLFDLLDEAKTIAFGPYPHPAGLTY